MTEPAAPKSPHEYSILAACTRDALVFHLRLGDWGSSMRNTLRAALVLFEHLAAGKMVCAVLPPRDTDGDTCDGQIFPTPLGAFEAELVDVFFIEGPRIALRFAEMPDIYLSSEDAHRIARAVSELPRPSFSEDVAEIKQWLKDEATVAPPLTSTIAQRTMLQSGIGKMARRDKGTVDRISATIILQGWMDKSRGR